MDSFKVKYKFAAIITILLLTTVGFIYNADRIKLFKAEEVESKQILPAQGRSDQVANDSAAKTVLFWTKMFSSDNMLFDKFGSELFQHCEVDNCYATSDKSFMPVELFDAILFHGIEYDKHIHGQPDKRNPHQRYVLVDLESPPNNRLIIKQSNGFYNWTMTYRADSDIFRPYGRFVERAGEAKSIEDVDVANKSKLVAWFVSNCKTNSRREEYVKELQKYIPVDVYGQCGKLKCKRSSSSDCFEMLQRDYKFYLSFENSLCRDYVTEKLFNILDLNIVPVVYGAVDYDVVAPPHSVVDVANFKSPQDLAKYLIYLNQNDQEYLRFYKWKKNYTVELQDVTWAQSACDLCKKLNDPSEPDTVYRNMNEWLWGANRSKCKF